MRKRRQKVAWFPNLGTAYGDQDPYVTTAQNLELLPELSTSTAPTIVSGSLLCVPITQDYTQNPNDSSTVESLRDFVEGQDYLLRRIVGKCHIGILEGSSATINAVWPKLLITAGFFVARAVDNDQTACGLDDSEIDPLARENIQQPWIWRNQWLLGNVGAADFTREGSYRVNNAVYATLKDGAHFDTKIARRIVKEHRLWFAASVQGLSSNTLAVTGDRQLQPKVQIFLDARVLGSLRRGKNTSSF